MQQHRVEYLEFSPESAYVGKYDEIIVTAPSKYEAIAVAKDQLKSKSGSGYTHRITSTYPYSKERNE